MLLYINLVLNYYNLMSKKNPNLTEEVRAEGRDMVNEFSERVEE